MTGRKIYYLYTITLFLVIPLFFQGIRADRDQWQQPERIMDSIGVRTGMVIGEVGAGNGYFTFKLAKQVGSTGHIYANDIDSRELKKIEQRCNTDNYANISTILGKVEDPMFPAGQLDMAVMMLVFHDLEKPVLLVNNIIPALKPGANLVIIDGDKEKRMEHRDHFYSKNKIITIMQDSKFELIRDLDFLSRDMILVFQVRTEG